MPELLWCWWQPELAAKRPRVNWRDLSLMSLYHGNMKATASFEEQDVVNYAHPYDEKIILLLEMGVTHDRTTFCCQCGCEVLSLHLHKPHAHKKSQAFSFPCRGIRKLDVLTDWLTAETPPIWQITTLLCAVHRSGELCYRCIIGIIEILHVMRKEMC